MVLITNYHAHYYLRNPCMSNDESFSRANANLRYSWWDKLNQQAVYHTAYSLQGISLFRHRQRLHQRPHHHPTGLPLHFLRIQVMAKNTLDNPQNTFAAHFWSSTDALVPCTVVEYGVGHG